MQLKRRYVRRLKNVWVLAGTFGELIKVCHCVTQLKWFCLWEIKNLGSLGLVDCNIYQNWDSSSGDCVFLGIWINPCSLVETFASEAIPRPYLEKIQKVCFLRKKIIKVFLMEMVLKLILRAWKIKRLDWINVWFRLVVVWCKMINSRDCLSLRAKRSGVFETVVSGFASFLSE